MKVLEILRWCCPLVEEVKFHSQITEIYAN